MLQRLQERYRGVGLPIGRRGHPVRRDLPLSDSQGPPKRSLLVELLVGAEGLEEASKPRETPPLPAKPREQAPEVDAAGEVSSGLLARIESLATAIEALTRGHLAAPIARELVDIVREARERAPAAKVVPMRSRRTP